MKRNSHIFRLWIRIILIDWESEIFSIQLLYGLGLFEGRTNEKTVGDALVDA